MSNLPQHRKSAPATLSLRMIVINTSVLGIGADFLLYFNDVPFEFRSINHITTIHNQRSSLHKTGFATSKEQNAVGNLLGSPHATHRRNLYSWCQYFCVGLGHWCVYHARADRVDSDEVFGVLQWHSVSVVRCDGVYWG